MLKTPPQRKSVTDNSENQKDKSRETGASKSGTKQSKKDR
jgi:hypothetical protein